MTKEKRYRIISSCIGCKNCWRNCPAGAISTGPMRIHPELCTGCGICYEKCHARKIMPYTLDVQKMPPKKPSH